MPKKILLILWLLYFLPSYGQVSPKRGLAYGYHTTADINAIAPGTNGISWWYNWSDSPDAAIASYYQSISVEFVPMVWGGSFNEATVIANIKPGTKYLLAFNEPNFTVQANLTPAQAVALWPKIEAIAAAKNLEIVSASAAYGGNMSGYGSAITWHDEFFSLCPTCKVDHIAFHAYDANVSSLIGVVGTMKKYGRPIWVTEFALWDPVQPAATKLTYLQQSVQAFENDPDIYRYSWFSGRVSSNPSIDIFGANGVLTTLGAAYRDAAYGPQSTIPGKIEAENHYRRKGIDKENTTDVGGGQNIGWFDPWDWGEYLVNVSTEGYYDFQFRVASLNTVGKFHLQLDDSVITNTVSFNATGGYQTWTTITVNNVPLKQGQHLLKFVSESNGFNVNYFNTTYVGPLANKDKTAEDQIHIYPNPFSDELIIDMKNLPASEEIQLLDVNGKLLKSFVKQQAIDVSDLSSGVYFVRIIGRGGVWNKRMVKK